MSSVKYGVVHITVTITPSDFLEDCVYPLFLVWILVIVHCFEQPSKYIDATLRLSLLHLKRGCNPVVCEVKAILFQCKLQHLQSFHEDRGNVISLLGVSLST